MDTESLVDAACDEIVDQTRNRNACLIFASGVQHGRHITQNLEEKYGIECGFVCGETPSAHRDHTLKRFKSGDLKYLCNVNVLTTALMLPRSIALPCFGRRCHQAFIIKWSVVGSACTPQSRTAWYLIMAAMS